MISLQRRAHSNEELIAGLVRGSPHAADAFYDRFAPYIKGMVWRLLGPDPEWADVVHQVFVQILSSVKRIKKSESLESWVARVTFFTVQQELRYRKYRRILVPQTEHVEQALDETDAESIYLTRRFFAALNKMKVEYRLLISLHYVEGYTMNEIAGIRGVSVRTAKRRMSKARKALYRIARADALLSSILEDGDDG